MVQQVRTALQTLTGAQKLIGALSGIGVSVVALVVFLSGYADLPEANAEMRQQIKGMEARIEILEAAAPQTQYLFCVDLADRGLITKTPQDCYQDYSLRGLAR